MPSVQLRTRSIARPFAARADDALGELLVAFVRDQVAHRRGGVVALAAREDEVDLLDLRPVHDANWPVQHFLASISRLVADQPEHRVQAVGIAGVGTALNREGGPPVPVAITFIEWPDCRWWAWRALLDADGALRADTESVRRAVDGDPMPDGLGRWWSLGRRANLQLSVRRSAPDVVSNLVN